jgi:hypothetical protein
VFFDLTLHFSVKPKLIFLTGQVRASMMIKSLTLGRRKGWAQAMI